MKLSKILERLEYTCLQGTLDQEIEEVVADSRKAKEGSLFICIRGAVVDGHTFTVKPLTFRMEKSANYPYHLLRMIYSFYIYAGTASFGGSHPNAFNFFKYAWIFRSALN